MKPELIEVPLSVVRSLETYQTLNTDPANISKDIKEFYRDLEELVEDWKLKRDALKEAEADIEELEEEVRKLKK